VKMLHVLLGFACAALRLLPGLSKLFSSAAALIIIVYEAWQAEHRTTVEDLAKFCFGFILGVILLP
jgi:hypothetical protein